MAKKPFKFTGTFLFFLLLLTEPFGSSNFVFPGESIDREPTIKAGLLLKFTNFVQWPESYSSVHKEEPLNICIHGEDKFGDIFDYINDHEILRREIHVKRNVPLPEVNGCHVLYLITVDKAALDNLANEITNSPVLVVTENEKISHSLVAINFRKVKNRMRFEINRSAFERSGLTISSGLLNLAINVVRID